jgi:hypothetical protein
MAPLLQRIAGTHLQGPASQAIERPEFASRLAGEGERRDRISQSCNANGDYELGNPMFTIRAPAWALGCRGQQRRCALIGLRSVLRRGRAPGAPAGPILLAGVHFAARPQKPVDRSRVRKRILALVFQ